MTSEGNAKRESFGTRLGFILVSAGCAIGIGNVWKFPYICGQNGGAVFLLFYLIFLLIMGVPVLTMELAIGRASGKTIVGGYKALQKPGSKWHIHGWICVLGNYLLMMYYTIVSGWMLAYFWKFLTGEFSGLSEEDIPSVFDDMLASPVYMMILTGVIILCGFVVVSFGVKAGLERISKVIMTGLILLIVLLVINSLFLDNADEGIRFYLVPNFETIEHIGIWSVITAAMNQAFFTLSLGLASMEVMGSYMTKEYTLTSESVKIAALDTIVAVMSGLIVFPACFSFNIEPDQGPSLIFITLPSVFVNMPGGRLWGALFFLFMTFASFSTVTAVFENIIGSAMDNLGWNRRRSVLVNIIIMLAASLPALLGYNVLSKVRLFGGMNILDSEDFLVSNIILPVGSLLIVLFCVNRFGWGSEKYLEETNTGTGVKMSRLLIPFYRFVLPVLILVIIIKGLLK